jgi:two-component system, OmpR family, KDP operon response regulator KdpE
MKNTPLVLVVDDEKPLRDFIQKNLEVRDFKVITASDGIEAVKAFNTQKVNLVILDVMMPRMDGLETTRRIRQSSIVPIIILTALDSESDKIKAFDLGADDYLTKPFGVGELLARVRAVLRRAEWVEPPIRQGELIHGDININLERHEVKVSGEIVKLTPTEFSLLVYLMEHAGAVLPHEAILKNVWGPEYGEETEYLRVYIGHLRQKVEVNPATPRYLLTERGIGYRFENNS